ncbi:MAG: GNAT family N-acetyltransferase [Candidatus Heimdallarchaeota archaeon]|nr:GNAT family N-acetyltransferase [Candidatus Heimdallarchaeota archaeon]MCK4610959.1 GNAT family N-acetyltransferase [Candidatus Heimdallarchaeota archaeon]
MPELESWVPPRGIIYIVFFDDKIAGMGGLKRNTADIAEIKRMYVKPDFRGKGLGKAIMNQLIGTAKNFGYSKLQLDTGPFMKAAHKIYKSAGFNEIEEYPKAEVPQEVRFDWFFMEKNL